MAGIISLSKQLVDDSNLIMLINIFSDNHKWKIVEFLCQRILEYGENKYALRTLADCYENSKEGLEHYVNVINNKPYTYGKHIAPHDIAVKEWGSGLTRIEKAKQLGVKFITAANISIVDGIEAVRSSFGKIWIDQSECVNLIKALEGYRQEYDHKRKIYKSHPLHDSNSHFADAMRYLCISLPKMRDGTTPEQLERRYSEALYGHNSNMPAVFRDDLPNY